MGVFFAMSCAFGFALGSLYTQWRLSYLVYEGEDCPVCGAEDVI